MLLFPIKGAAAVALVAAPLKIIPQIVSQSEATQTKKGEAGRFGGPIPDIVDWNNKTTQRKKGGVGQKTTIHIGLSRPIKIQDWT